MESCPVFELINWTLKTNKLNNNNTLHNTTCGNFLYTVLLIVND